MLKSLPNKLLWTFIILSFLGFADSTYLTVSHYTGIKLGCVTGGCDTVTASKYSEIFGIPIAAGGIFYYLTIFCSSLFYLDRKNAISLKIITFLPITGFLTSLYLVYLQLFVIKAICQYCMLSAITSTLLFVCGLFILTAKSPKPS